MSATDDRLRRMERYVAAEIQRRRDVAEEKYGDFMSTHEALGVITEEYHELIEAVRQNSLDDTSMEAIDIAAACIRLAVSCEMGKIKERSTK